MEMHGYKQVSVDLPYLAEGQLAHAMTILSEMANRAQSDCTNPRDWFSGLNPANKVLLAVGDQTPASDYLLAQQLRNMLMQQLAFLYDKYPGLLIITPTTPMAGWPIKSEADLKHGFTDGNTSIRNMQFVWLANFCGNPAISCPIDYVDPKKGQGRIPVGLMAMAEWGAENSLLEWGKLMEKRLKRERPSNWEDVIGNTLSEVAR
jgi:Asp-tRNA(Asn)/Glu-tRNA(Gln) amidotransferase A subunit family amidase